MILEDPQQYFIWFFFGSVALSVAMYYLVWRLAHFLEIYDRPDAERKIHRQPIPKLGGLVIFFSFVLAVIILAVLGGTDELSSLRLAGFFIGAVILAVGGVLDDKYDLSPGKQIWFPVLAVLAVVLSGTHISFITNPFGGAIVLDQYKVFTYPVLGSLFVYLWILGMTYTTKFLDGMDGLVSGISVIAGVVIFALSLAPEVSQTSTAFISLVFAGSALGFLFFNFHPAKMFLGESGSTLTGFIIGTLAVISGGKIATALLVLGIPILDVAWVIVQRLWFGRSPFKGDNTHLHFRLLDIGLSQRQAVLLLYLFSIGFGGIAVFLQSIEKLIALGVLFAVMIGVIITLAFVYRRKQTKGEQNYD